MNFSNDKLLFVDEGAGQQLTYRELFERFGAADFSIYPTRPFASARMTISNLIAALLQDVDLTLLDQNLSQTELQNILGDLSQLDQKFLVPNARSRSIDSSEELAQRLFESRSRLTLFSSGTTGTPKRFQHSVSTFTRSVRLGPSYQNDVWALAYNVTHMAGLQVLFQALSNGNTLVNVFGSAPETVFEQLEKWRVTHLSATPTFFRLISFTTRTFPEVRRVSLGGEKTTAELCAKVQRIFPNAKLNNIYASTELGTLLISHGDSFSVPVSLKEKIKIENGLLQVHRSLQSLADPAESDPREWIDTGDRVEVLHSDPLTFRFVGRDSDFINVAGYNVNPREVEEILLEHSGVRAARVYGQPHSLVGNLLIAEILPSDPNLSESHLREFLTARVQPHKIPRIIKWTQHLEMTRTGKTKSQ